MRKQWIITVLVALLAYQGARPLPAADNATGDWGSLRSAVVGKQAEIRSAGRPALRGKVTVITDEEIQVRSGNQLVSIPRNDVEQIAVKQKSKRFRNTLLMGAIGAGIAAAIGFGAVAATGGSDDVAGVVTLPIALGAAAGAGIGAAVPRGYRAVYRR